MKSLTEAKSVTELLQNLIQIPSINADSVDEANAEWFGELNLANALKPFLEELGYVVTLEEVRPDRPNLIARLPGMEGKPRVFFGPHLDTVPVEGMTIVPFSGELKDGRIWGRGASDTKGPMAAMLWALKLNAEKLQTLPVAVDFVGFMGEETNQEGAKHFVQRYTEDYDFAIVGEPTSLQIVNVTKGCLWVSLQANGKSSHASKPHLGENAIEALMQSLGVLLPRLKKQLNEFVHPILETSTLNLGTIHAGTNPNLVPDKALAQLDIRTVPQLWEKGGALAMIHKIIKEENLSLDVKTSGENPPMEVLEQNKWIQLLQEANPSSRCVGAPWFSDAAHLNLGGISSVCVGPGSIDQAHTKDEFIKREDLDSGVDYFCHLISNI